MNIGSGAMLQPRVRQRINCSAERTNHEVMSARGVRRQLGAGGCFVSWVVVSRMSAVPPKEPTAAVSLDRGYRS